MFETSKLGIFIDLQPIFFNSFASSIENAELKKAMEFLIHFSFKKL